MNSLVDDLRVPAAYPVPRPAAIELRETHASWVFLGEGEVWKVKRPVNFGFLDFSTREKRRQCCEEEVRLNRRLAPDVYRDVVPITRGEHGHAVAPIGAPAPVDFAVHMRRLPDHDAALALVRAGTLTADHLRALAARLADFYAGLPALKDGEATDHFAAAVRENFDQAELFAGRFVDPVLLDEIRAAQTGALARHLPRLRAREAAGAVREGHGDLRLEHVYFPDGRAEAPPVCIDAVEFNRGFRVADVGLDVAFLAMELLAEGRRDLAEDFLAAFAQASNDFEIYAPMDLFLGYRAFVRAKVACIVAGDAGTPPAKRQRKADEAARLFALARALCEPPGRAPWLLVVGGLPGTGKSTLAEGLSCALHAPVVSSDRTRKHLSGVPPTERGSAALYTDDVSRRTMARMFRHAGDVLGSGRGVILDGTFRRAVDRMQARERATAAGCRFLFVETHCDEAVVRERLHARQRQASVSDADAAVFERLQAEYEAPSELPQSERLIVDTGLPIAAQVEQVRAHLGSPG